MGWFSKPKAKTVAKAGSGVLGLTAAGAMALSMLIQPWEQRIHTTYIDTVGGNRIPTVCAGVTGPDVIVGKTYTDQECDALEAKHVKIADVAVSKAVTYPVHDYTKASFISFTYNVGVGAFLRSTLLKKANAGDVIGACNELNKWVFVKKQRIAGLENRRVKGSATRISERTLCMIGVDPKYKTPLFEIVYVAYQDWREQYEGGNS